MTKPILARRSARWSAACMILVLAALCNGGIIPLLHSQAPSTSTSNASLTALLTQLKMQQDTMAANQTKIEVQTAQLDEALRQAKIYSARSGAGHR